MTTKQPPKTTKEHHPPASEHDAPRARFEVNTAFDVFGSEFPDETFAGVFDQPRPTYKGHDWEFRGL
ncbi:hypothetical protein [Bradyrhizobium cajani]|uniref:Uncharacterized protein n=1 Tax=Bradyrhizobium cajani TaxID=1928661 RepID=A0A844TJP1_9BRAD|nr:hypothetical protein [Bradyrhizobium cajani]MCP3369011.1 hypothetical protein [Bradyrhizobium cajani]MVT76084.1 hypothetical protein [Bradyrhizobium cajani]